MSNHSYPAPTINLLPSELSSASRLHQNIGYPCVWTIQLLLGAFGIVANAYQLVILIKVKKMDRAVRHLLMNLTFALVIFCVPCIYRAGSLLVKLSDKNHDSFSCTLRECQIFNIWRIVPVHVVILSILLIAIERFYAGANYNTYSEQRALRWCLFAAGVAWVLATSEQMANYILSLSFHEKIILSYCTLASGDIKISIGVLGTHITLELVAVCLLWLCLRGCRIKLAKLSSRACEDHLESKLRLRRIITVTKSMTPIVLTHLACFFIVLPATIIAYAAPGLLTSPEAKEFLAEVGTYTVQMCFAAAMPVVCLSRNEVLAEMSKQTMKTVFGTTRKVESSCSTSEFETDLHFRQLDQLWKKLVDR